MTVNWMPLYVVWMLNIEFRFKFGKLRREQKVKNKVIWSPLHCKHRVQVTTMEMQRNWGRWGHGSEFKGFLLLVLQCQSQSCRLFWGYIYIF